MQLHIVYASTSGNVEIVVEKVAAYLREQGVAVDLHRAEQTSIELFHQNDTFLLATSTWEHGVLNHFFHPLHAELKKMDLMGKKAGFIGLGDNRYEPVLFCNGLEIVRKTWLDNDGQQIFHNLKINGEPYHLLDTTVLNWAKEFHQALLTEETHNGENAHHPVYGEHPLITF